MRASAQMDIDLDASNANLNDSIANQNNRSFVERDFEFDNQDEDL